MNTSAPWFLLPEMFIYRFVSARLDPALFSLRVLTGIVSGNRRNHKNNTHSLHLHNLFVLPFHMSVRAILDAISMVSLAYGVAMLLLLIGRISMRRSLLQRATISIATDVLHECEVEMLVAELS